MSLRPDQFSKNAINNVEVPYAHLNSKDIEYGYEESAYIEFSGGAYIDTGFPADGSMEIQCVAKLLSFVESHAAIYYARESATAGSPGRGTFLQSGAIRNDYTSAGANIPFADSLDTVLKINDLPDKVTVNGVEILTRTQAYFDSGNNLFLGLTNPMKSSAFNGRIYSFKMTNFGQLSIDLMPVKSGQVINGQTATADCFYDKVNDVFLTNKGTGTLTYGKGDTLSRVAHFRDPNRYIQFDGNVHIDTKLPPTTTQRITTKYVADPSSVSANYRFLYGSRVGANANSRAFLAHNIGSSSSIRSDFANNTNSVTLYTPALENMHIIDDSQAAFIIDGEARLTNRTGTITNTTPILLGDANTDGVPRSDKFIGKVYSFKIHDDGRFRRDFYPVYKGEVIEGNVAPEDCFYDFGTKTFFTGEGGGTLTFGRDGWEKKTSETVVLAGKAKRLVLKGKTIQEGTGTPSPSNVRQISNRVITNHSTNPSFETGSGTVEVRRNLIPSPSFASGVVALGWTVARADSELLVGKSPYGGNAAKIIPTVNTVQGSQIRITASSTWRPVSGQLSLSARLPNIDTASSRVVTVIFELNASPYTKYIEQGITITKEWKRFSFPYTIPAGESDADAQLAVRSIYGYDNTPFGYEVSAFMLEDVQADLPYFDGSYNTWQSPDLTPSWTGEANNSASILTGVKPVGITTEVNATWSSVTWLSSDTPYHGAKFLRTLIRSVGASGDTNLVIRDSSGVEASQQYVFSTRIRTTKAGLAPLRQTYSTAGGWVQNMGEVPMPVGVWYEDRILRTTVVANQTIGYSLARSRTSAGTFFDIDNHFVIKGDYAGAYFDGNTPGATWTGTANASTSTILDHMVSDSKGLLLSSGEPLYGHGSEGVCDTIDQWGNATKRFHKITLTGEEFDWDYGPSGNGTYTIPSGSLGMPAAVTTSGIGNVICNYFKNGTVSEDLTVSVVNSTPENPRWSDFVFRFDACVTLAVWRDYLKGSDVTLVYEIYDPQLKLADNPVDLKSVEIGDTITGSDEMDLWIEKSS